MDLRQLRVKLQNLIVRAVVDRSSDTNRRGPYQVAHFAGRAVPGVEILQPQGLHFHVPAGADGLLLAPAGETSSAVMVAASGATPGGEGVQPGEGGLHYLGAYKVFVNAGGEVHLGEQVADDFVALAGLVDARIAAIVAYINAHVHSGVTTGAGSSAAPAPSLGAQASVAATLVKAT